MRFPWPEVVAAAWAMTGAAPGVAQQAGELGVEAMATSSDPALVVVGPYGAVRGSERTRISALIGAGFSDGDFAWRAETLGHFMLSPAERRGWGAYLAGGLAAVGGEVSRGYLILALGAEERPGSSSGWVTELGIGGGLRVVVGYRWRHFRHGWSQ